MNHWSRTANGGHAVGPECQATPKLLKVSVLLGMPVCFPEKRLVEPKGCAEPGPGSPDPVSGEWGRTSRERGEAPASHTLQTTSQIPQRALFCTCAWKQRVGVLELFLISPDGWVPVLDNKHCVKPALCSAAKAGIGHWIPELVRVFDVATLGLTPP